jgi:hypothetical protein
MLRGDGRPSVDLGQPSRPGRAEIRKAVAGSIEV